MNMISKLLFIFATLAAGGGCQKNGPQNDSILTVVKDSTGSLVAMKESDYRPIYHFTPPQKWMNDPNGMFYHKGKFHLFYQHNPEKSLWGPMHWGHASSTDMFNWQDHPIALYPDQGGTIFSGSTVVDAGNTSGFKSGNEDPLVAIYTLAGQSQQQAIAYSIDGGYNWTKYQQNPVLPNPGVPDFRDPKVFRHEGRNLWIQALAVGQKISFYSSPDLKNWNFESSFGEGVGAHGGVWECPDLFELPIEGTDKKKWVLLVSINPGGPNGGSATQYFIGDFDGKNFTADSNETNWMDWGTDNYAGVTFSNFDKSGKKVLMGWMSNWMYAEKVPTNTWRSTNTVPREMSLVQNGQSLILKSVPVSEISKYKTGQPTQIPDPVQSIDLKTNPIIKKGSYEIEFVADFSKTSQAKLTLGNSIEKFVVSLDRITNQITIDRSASGQVDFNPLFKNKIIAPYILQTNKPTKVRILVDRTSLELFVDDGALVVTSLFFPKYFYEYVKVEGDKEQKALSNFQLTELGKSMLR